MKGHPTHGTDLQARVYLAEAPTRDQALGSSKIGAAGRNEPVEVGFFDDVIVQQEQLADSEVPEGKRCLRSRTAETHYRYSQAGESFDTVRPEHIALSGEPADCSGFERVQ